MITENRRKHERLEMTEHAVAVDSNGAEIGKVIRAGGGGMTVESASEKVADRFRTGERIGVTILEPASQTRNTIDMVLRHRDGRHLGFEFVTGADKS